MFLCRVLAFRIRINLLSLLLTHSFAAHHRVHTSSALDPLYGVNWLGSNSNIVFPISPPHVFFMLSHVYTKSTQSLSKLFVLVKCTNMVCAPPDLYISRSNSTDEILRIETAVYF